MENKIIDTKVSQTNNNESIKDRFSSETLLNLFIKDSLKRKESQNNSK